MTWQQIIRVAANNRFSKTGSCDPFLLAKRDLCALVEEICRVNLVDPGDGVLRYQARVFVPEIGMHILVDEWQ